MATPALPLIIDDEAEEPISDQALFFPHSETSPEVYPLGFFLDRIICGDTLEVMRSMPGESIDLIVTSPPYNLRNSTGNGMKDGRGGKWANASLIEGYASHSDCMDHDEYAQWQRECLTEMLRLIKSDGAIFYNHKWRVQAGRLQDRQDIVGGFPIRQIIIWKRKGGINFNRGYFLPTYEVVYLIAKPGFRLAPKASRHGDIWEFTQEMNNPHPAPFPLDLIDRIVSSTIARIVLDPFAGSGTTAVAARTLGRHFIGIDISPEYCEMAVNRLNDLEGNSLMSPQNAGKLVGIYTGTRKGEGKASVESAELIVDHGLRGDSHAGRDPNRQVSLFAAETLRELQREGFQVSAEQLSANLLTENIELDSLKSGTRLRIGGSIIEIVEARKPCRAITRIDNRLPKRLYGQCGLMARIVKGGAVRAGDCVTVLVDERQKNLFEYNRAV